MQVHALQQQRARRLHAGGGPRGVRRRLRPRAAVHVLSRLGRERLVGERLLHTRLPGAARLRRGAGPVPVPGRIRPAAHAAAGRARADGARGVGEAYKARQEHRRQ